MRCVTGLGCACVGARGFRAVRLSDVLLVSYWDLGFNRHPLPFCPAAQKRKEHSCLVYELASTGIFEDA